ncbi:MAG TPA: aspartate racemase [Firmicutes bacterium]|nr:aspartate racemase [Bacillota bacterium]
MKTIGLIGGMSWESTAHYYSIINEAVKERCGGLHSAKCIIYSVDFEEIEHLQSIGAWKQAGEILAMAAGSLEKAGADFLIICTNTMHKVFDEIAQKVQIPILHIADATAGEIKAAHIQKVGLLGTQYTMEQDFYKSRLEQAGINVMAPEENDRKLINQVIYQELCLGKIIPESRKQYQRIIGSLETQGAQGIILGCTEIGLLIQQQHADIPLFDTTMIHALKAVSYALE